MTPEWPDEKKKKDSLSSSIESEDLELGSEITDDIEEDDDAEERDDKQQLSFGYIAEVKETWKEEWRDMPEFIHEDSKPWKTIHVHFENREDMNAFSKLIGQQITFQTRSLWYPIAEMGEFANKRYGDFDES